MVGRWSGNGRAMVGQWSGYGRAMVRRWSGNGRAMVSVKNREAQHAPMTRGSADRSISQSVNQSINQSIDLLFVTVLIHVGDPSA
eukprot:11219714-Lingulodinium_polyedra.AAC.1